MTRSGLRIAVFDDWFGHAARSSHLEQLRQVGAVTVYDDHPAPAQVRARLALADAVVLWRDRTYLTADVIDASSAVRLVVQTGGHAEHLDLDLLTRLGVEVVMSPIDWEDHPTAEFVLAMILALLHQIPASDRRMRSMSWPIVATKHARGRTLGLVGYGRLARDVAAKAAALGMSVAAWSRSLDVGSCPDPGVRAVPLDQVLSESDVVSVMLRLVDETRGFVGRRELESLRPDAYLVNTARGGVIDEDALVRLLQEQRIAGAALDVYQREPLPLTHPFRTLDNVVLTPHLGWAQDETQGAMFEMAVENLVARVTARGL